MKNKRLPLIILICVFLLGFLIKFYYISYTETWMRQHDVISFGAEEGHAAYIEYILNNKSLPDFDPREKWAFFQPPLHHFVSAVSMAFSRNLGLSEKSVQENVQLLTFAYMCIVMIVSYFICKKLAIGKKSTLITMAIICVHPIFTLLSGSINNDALSLMLAVLSIYMAIMWYERQTIINTILLALFIGLSMMAKLTGALVAPGIGILMVMKIFEKDKSLNSLKNYLVRLILFAVVVAPLGLWWSIRNIIKWHMPVNYIPPVGEQFPENITLTDRLFDMSIRSPYVSLISNGDSYDEHNVFYALFKTSVFGEYDYSQYSRMLVVFAWILLIVSIMLALLSFIGTVTVIINLIGKTKVTESGANDNMVKNAGAFTMLAITYFVYMAAYLSFALSYSNFSAQDFRYGAITIVIESIFLGKYLDINKSKVQNVIVMALTMIFFICSLLIYSVIGLRT